jgi:hypothetical protein
MEILIDEYWSNALNKTLLYISVLFTLVAIFFAFRAKKYNGRDLLSYIPNIWTSFGILGTFLSIILAIKGIDNKGVDDNPIDITKLVKEITPAFSTSIVGIIGAIVSSLILKIIFAFEDRGDDKRKNTPEYTLKNIESLLKDSIEKTESQSKRMEDTLAEQSEIMKRFVDDFIQNMDEIFKNMKDSIAVQTRQFGETQLSKSCEIMEKITNQLIEKGNEMVQIHLKNTLQMMDNTNQEFGQVHTTLFDSLTVMKERLTEDTTKIGEFISSRFNFFVQELRVTCEDFNNSIDLSVGSLKESYNFIESRSSQIVSNYEQAVVAYKDAVQNAHNLNEEETKLLESMTTTMYNHEQTNQNVIKVLDLVQSRQEAIENLTIRIQEMSMVIESLQRLESQLNRLNR